MFQLFMSKSRFDHTVTWNSDYSPFQKQLVIETLVGGAWNHKVSSDFSYLLANVERLLKI